MAQRTFLGQLKELKDKVNMIQPEVLQTAAQALVYLSPDDTGAYVLSHSIGRSGNVGRSISSHGRQSAPGTHKGAALDLLMDQIANIPPDATRIWIGNNSPHVNMVEFGWPTKPGYAVYTQFRSLFPGYIKDAIRQVGLK
jgi:hypothetical protein